jgi:hypothetical protein
MSHDLEQKLQEGLAIWLTLNKVLFCASAGGLRTSRSQAIRMKRAGYKAGHPDIVIYEPRAGWHGMTIEDKIGTYPSQEQKTWQVELLKRGYYAIIVPGKFDFREARKYLEDEITRYLAGKIKRI